jgi:hypothetical protein
MERSLDTSEEQVREAVIAFYAGERPDSEGRMIEEIWAWDYESLEYVHNYIQWIFPLKQQSSFNPDAPLVNDRVIEAFTTNELLRARLIKSLEQMLKFYGLQCIERRDGNTEITKSDEYERRKRNWITSGNHNYLRLTRILISLDLLGAAEYSRALFKCLDQIYKEESAKIGSTTHSYWENAVREHH